MKEEEFPYYVELNAWNKLKSKLSEMGYEITRYLDCGLYKRVFEITKLNENGILYVVKLTFGCERSRGTKFSPYGDAEIKSHEKEILQFNTPKRSKDKSLTLWPLYKGIIIPTK